MQICLVGAGHAHILLLKQLTKVVTPGIQWVFVNPFPVFSYTGHWTSVLSGEKNLSSVEVPLESLLGQIRARGNHISFRIDEVFDLNPRTKSLRFRHAGEVLVETISLNVAGESPYPQLLPLKPIQIPARLLESETPERLQIVGGGATGIETALCLAARFRREKKKTKIQLVEKGAHLWATAPRELQKKALLLLGEAGIEVLFHSDFLLSAADIRLSAVPQQTPKWLRDSGLKQAGKYLAINSRLETSTPGIFAVGEGTQNPEDPTPQNSLVPIRQSQILFQNLLHRCGAEASTKIYTSQDTYLTLLNTGDGRAMGYKGPYSLGHSKFNLWLKNKLDERFLKQII